MKDRDENKVIYIGGYGRSGSTLLDAYLSSSKNAIGIGEFSNYLDDRIHGRNCSCGDKLSDCSFWKNFNKNIAESDLKDLSTAARHNERLSLRRRKMDGAYYSYLKEVLGFCFSDCDFVVDSSKTTRLTFFRAVNISQLSDVFFIHLYREPRTLIGSLKKGSNKHLAGMKEKERRFVFMGKSVLGWIVGNLGAVYASWKIKNGIIVSYEDFCANPELLINRLNQMGVNLAVPREITPGHGVSGNRMRSALTKIKSKERGRGRLSFVENIISFLMGGFLKIAFLFSRYSVFKR